jgi:hypothetical protein
MATHDYIISNASGAAVRADLNNALAAIATNNSSATAPTTTYAYQWWADTGSSPTVMKLRNAANSAWITLFQLDGEWSLIPFENGTAAAPSIYFKDSGTDTGIFSPGTDQVGITTGGSVRLTTSTTAFTGTLPWQGQNGTAAAPALSFSGDPNTGIYNVGADQLGISTNGTLRFDVSTTATTSTLPVVHPLGAVGTPSITFTGDLNTGIYSPAADTLAFVEGGAEAARIDSSGRLLAGTTTARTNFFNATNIGPLLQIEGADTASSSASLVRNSADTSPPSLILAKSRSTGYALVSSGDALGRIPFMGADGSELVEAALILAEVDGTPGANDMPGRLIFSTTADGASSPTERMRISQNGQVALTSSNTLGLNGGILTANNTSTSSSGVGALVSSIGVSGSANNTNCFHLMAITQGVAYYYLYGNGTSSFTSDARKKKNIETTRDGYLEDLSKLRVVKYNWCNHDDGDPKELGLIAQEVEQVFPGLVQEGGQLEGDDFNCKVLKGSVLPFMLLKALQEAAAKIETLEAKVAALEAA